MAHAINMLVCSKGHILPIGYDSNECGCHDEGKPCIILHCSECSERVYIPLGKEGIEAIKKLGMNKKQSNKINESIKDLLKEKKD